MKFSKYQIAVSKPNFYIFFTYELPEFPSYLLLHKLNKRIIRQMNCFQIILYIIILCKIILSFCLFQILNFDKLASKIDLPNLPSYQKFLYLGCPIQ
ncbi:hypothetical protein BpHYR1_023570 [Brachionus plicatilis]|uniref:Transmembrane protein n=1 Tax=Brachionus plicatilis TaxID=10195 RepID=A0A3M7PG93_BRAPC|nr:hypothetical protein BpHYR1_023570 [Brachionus plicatilis]